jgi:hypothetical protein
MNMVLIKEYRVPSTQTQVAMFSVNPEKWNTLYGTLISQQRNDPK